MSSNNMDASCHTTLYRVKWPWLDISCSRDQDQTNVASVGVLGICGRVGGSSMVLSIISRTTFTVYNLCISFDWIGRKAARDEPFYNTILPSLFFENATSDLAKSYATLAHFNWFMLTYYNNPVLIGFHKTWNVEGTDGKQNSALNSGKKNSWCQSLSSFFLETLD